MTNHVNLWDVYYLLCRHTKPVPKNKFVIILAFATNPMGFLINSSINQFVLKRPHLLPCEVKLEQSEHSFLAYDSFVDCRDLFPFLPNELSDFRGQISEKARSEILMAAAACPVLPREYQRLIANTHIKEGNDEDTQDYES